MCYSFHYLSKQVSYGIIMCHVCVVLGNIFVQRNEPVESSPESGVEDMGEDDDSTEQVTYKIGKLSHYTWHS